MNHNKKKVGIITLHGYHNYGNRLQNYALQETIKELGFDVETVVVVSGNTSDNLIEKLSKISTMSRKEVYKKILNKIKQKTNYYFNKKLIHQRIKVFKDFSKKYLSEKVYYCSNNDELKNLSLKYDFFITGSDQVWNPLYKSKLPIYFLTFAEKHKRISYAPSFGVSEIPYECIEEYRKYLYGMHKLSVREEAGAEIIKDLTGLTVPVLIDPTLLLSKEKWMSISKEAIYKPKNNYLLTYFLGDISDENRKMINNIANMKNLQIVNLGDIRDRKAYVAGPCEFIDYISSASLLCTDSFHGCVFSILLGTPFIVIKRNSSQSMYSRIETLLSKFQLESRKVENIKTTEQIFEVDYSHIPSILDVEREKAIKYLKEALNVEMG